MILTASLRYVPQSCTDYQREIGWVILCTDHRTPLFINLADPIIITLTFCSTRCMVLHMFIPPRLKQIGSLHLSICLCPSTAALAGLVCEFSFNVENANLFIYGTPRTAYAPPAVEKLLFVAAKTSQNRINLRLNWFGLFIPS